MSSSSDSESDDEEKKKLASVVCGYEATVPNLHSKEEKKAKQNFCNKGQIVNGKAKKSLRNVEEEDFNIMRTSPEFKNFIAKKLDAFLETEILDQDCPDSSKSVIDVNNEEKCVKLLSQSKVCLGNAAFDTVVYTNTSRNNKNLKSNTKKKKSLKRSSESCTSSDDSSDEEETKRFRLAAISTESVLSGTAILSHKS